jgi:hypothetical protein
MMDKNGVTIVKGKYIQAKGTGHDIAQIGLVMDLVEGISINVGEPSPRLGLKVLDLNHGYGKHVHLFNSSANFVHL